MEDETNEEMKTDADTNAEMLGEDADCETSGVAADSEDANKTEEQRKVSVPRFAPHTVPDWNLEEMRERWMWNVRIYPIHQDDCKNCLLDAATKIAQESWYYVPKVENGQGHAELCLLCPNKVTSVMSRIITMPFYYRFVTIELTRRADEGGDPNATQVLYKTVAETATIVFDSTKIEKIQNTDMSKGPLKKRRIWLRYLPENTTPEILRVLFPLSQSTEVQPHDNLWIGLVETRSRTDVQIFTKSFLTLIINGKLILSLYDKKRTDSETDTKDRLEKAVTPLENRVVAPIEVADRTEHNNNENKISRSLKRTLNHQQHTLDARRVSNNNNNRGRQEPPPKRRALGGGGGGGGGGGRGGGGGGGRGGGGGGRGGGGGGGRGGGGGGGNRRERRRSSGGRYGGGRDGGGGGGYGYPGAHSGYGGYVHPEDVAAEMMLMQAELSHTLQNQLMMLGPDGEGSGGGYYGGGPRGGYGGGGHSNYGGW